MLKSKDTTSSGIAHNIMGAGTKVVGNIYTTEDFRIDGELEGNIDCKGKVVMGPNGKVIGSISCGSADLMGQVDGNIEVHGILSLRSSFVLNGDVLTERLEIEPGALFNGSCKMIQQ